MGQKEEDIVVIEDPDEENFKQMFDDVRHEANSLGSLKVVDGMKGVAVNIMFTGHGVMHKGT